MIAIDEALRLVLECAKPLETEPLDLTRAVGRVIAERLTAPHDLPPFHNSAMDGFAVRSEDTHQATPDSPIHLRIVGESSAGRGYGAEVRSGEAVAISTGAPVPQGADAVVPKEQVAVQDGWVLLKEPVKTGRHVRPKGEDVPAGSPVLEAGSRVQLSHIPMLAALGLTPLRVYRQPRVTVLVTGNELLSYNAPLQPDCIRDSNSVMLRLWLEAQGYPCHVAGTAPDELTALVEKLEQALSEAEVLILTGGVSVGEHDLVKPALQQIGAEVVFWRVNMKPGKPILFAVRKQGDGFTQAIFGLPGNPLSALVGLLAFVLPYLRALEGDAKPVLPMLKARLAETVQKKELRAEFQTARLYAQPDGTLHVVPNPAQGSSLMGSLAMANAFLYLPPGPGEYPAGSLVDVLPVAQLEVRA